MYAACTVDHDSFALQHMSAAPLAYPAHSRKLALVKLVHYMHHINLTGTEQHPRLPHVAADIDHNTNQCCCG